MALGGFQVNKAKYAGLMASLRPFLDLQKIHSDGSDYMN